MRVIVLAILSLLAVASAWWWSRPPATAPLLPVIQEVPVQRLITVHVSGAVARPGLVELSEGARVADAVSAAGGALHDADLAALNLAGRVIDESQVVVPRIGNHQAQTATADGKIRINQATAAEIESLPGVGPVLAARIVEHRDAFGPFQEVEDLLDVSGIGEAKLASLRDHLTIP